MNSEIKEKTTVKNNGKPSLKGLLEHIIDAYGIDNVSKLVKVNKDSDEE